VPRVRRMGYHEGGSMLVPPPDRFRPVSRAERFDQYGSFQDRNGTMHDIMRAILVIGEM
jgi:hypothetical protein